jgi:hypothetical protein
MRVFIFILLCLLVACEESKPVASRIAGTTEVLKRDCLLFQLTGTAKSVVGAHYQLVDADANNSWRKEGYIKAGTSVKIDSVRQVKTDERGSWIAVLGSIGNAESAEERTFVYNWSFGSQLRRAPWEDSSVPEYRSSE